MKIYKLFITYFNKSITMLFAKCKDKNSLYAMVGYIYSNSLTKIDRIDYKEVQDISVVDKYFMLSSQGTLIHITHKEDNVSQYNIT